MIEKIVKFFLPLMRLLCFHREYKMNEQDRSLFYFGDLSGAMICSRIDFCISNLFIKGYWKHSAIITNNFTIIEAVTKEGVREITIDEFLKDKDHYIVMIPKFFDENKMLMIINNAKKYIGEEYDNSFERYNKKHYCSEVVIDAIDKVDDSFWTNKDEIFTPQDLVDSGKFYTIARVSRRK